MKPIETITIDDIRKLFRKYFNINITRAAIYRYQKTKGFPHNMKIGKPRIWRKDLVLEWFVKQSKS